jgi:phytoene dehydrogenase-like protein
MINAPAIKKDKWNAIQDEYRQIVIDKINALLDTNLESLIEVEHRLNPASIDSNTGSYLGALYGTSSNGKYAAFLRHANTNSNIKGLYFCGGSVHPGGGIPLCLQSAKIAVDLTP